MSGPVPVVGSEMVGTAADGAACDDLGALTDDRAVAGDATVDTLKATTAIVKNFAPHRMSSTRIRERRVEDDSGSAPGR